MATQRVGFGSTIIVSTSNAKATLLRQLRTLRAWCPADVLYDFPAEHWAHLRTTNPIESTFATIRLRHRKTKGSGTRRTSLAMMFKLAQSASKKWRRLQGYKQIIHVVEGRTFKDGELQQEIAA